MLPTERRQAILELLFKKKVVRTQDICNFFFVSPATARRDLIEMEKENLIIRSHGGAILPSNSITEQSYTLRETQSQQEKNRIADMASTFITDGLSLFMDSSTTVKSLIPFLQEFKDLVIVTNGLQNALELTRNKQIETIVIGGTLYPGSSSTVGAQANISLANYNIDISFISCRGLDEDGVYEANESQGIIKQKMIQNSAKRILLCDSSKFNSKFLYKSADLETFDYVITDKIPCTQIHQQLSNRLIEA